MKPIFIEVLKLSSPNEFRKVYIDICKIEEIGEYNNQTYICLTACNAALNVEETPQEIMQKIEASTK